MTNFHPFDNEYEIITGQLCPNCGFPLAEEYSIAVCYYCGWSEDIFSEED